MKTKLTLYLLSIVLVTLEGFASISPFAAKKMISQYYQELDSSSEDDLESFIENYHSEDHSWYGVHPFRQMADNTDMVNRFWRPLKSSFKGLNRKLDILISGKNELDPDSQWVMAMGHMYGNFAKSWLKIPATGKLAHIRFASFHKIEDGKIAATGMFLDLLGVMELAGVNPLKNSTGRYFMYPGPETNDGVSFLPADSGESEKTLMLVNEMVEDLNQLNESGALGCPPDLLRKTWHEEMKWYGPCGIGASYTIEGYQKQHQLPFRKQLGDKKFNGHVCRFAEGNFACFFGWPNLTNRNLGGFLGLPASGVHADMQVVDVYRREGDLLKENWILIDLPYWLLQQGVDVFKSLENDHLVGSD